MKYGWPSSIVGRTVIVLLLGLIISNFAGFAFYWTERSRTLSSSLATQVAERIISFAQIVEELPVEERRPFVRETRRTPGLRITWTRNAPQAAGKTSNPWALSVRDAVVQELGKGGEARVRVSTADPAAPPEIDEGDDRPDRDFRGNRWRSASRFGHGFGHGFGPRPGSVFDGSAGPEDFMVLSLALSDGSWLNFHAPTLPLRPFWSSSILLPMLAATLAVIAISVWAVWRATAPLAFFTRAAERLGRDVNAPPLVERGPREVHRAARAFNEMQTRLRSFIEDRTRMLAAISHDLRTPITRMRLRAEFVEDDEQRRKMLADLAEMEAMIAATLSFAREDAAGEAQVPLDLADLLQSLCDAAVDAGHAASYAGERRFSFNGAPTGLKRAFGNLIDNAIKYGGTARVSLQPASEKVVVTVEDDGPGIPPNELEKVFTAFYRVEGSRSRETGGVGLGLAVVRTIVRAHGGEVTLENREEGGLRVVVTLPRG
jgi:signal transduction histidine kinase